MRITVFGVGYVGLVQAAALADVGNDVVAVDIDEAKIEALSAGRITIFEPGLERLVQDNLAEGRLRFSSDAVAAIHASPLIFIAVGTPSRADGSADLSQVSAVAERIGDVMANDKTVVLKSTAPVGTTDMIETIIRARLAGRGAACDVAVAANPEFLKEGSAVRDFMRPDRIVVGTASAEAELQLREVFRPFNRNSEKIIVMGVRSAELTKYAANALLASRISFMNEIAAIADEVGADIEQIRLGVGADDRIGPQFLYAGVGYGGACFPKDVRALIATAREIGVDARLVQAIEHRNEIQKNVLFEKIRRHFGGRLEGRTVALWGLAFKPTTDDMRLAPSRHLMELLWQHGARVQAYDPKAMDECRRLYGSTDGLVLCENKEAALDGADALAVVTDWRAFQAPDFALIASALGEKVVFDGRNIYDPAILARYGLTLVGIGRSTTPS